MRVKFRLVVPPASVRRYTVSGNRGPERCEQSNKRDGPRRRVHWFPIRFGAACPEKYNARAAGMRLTSWGDAVYREAAGDV